MPIRVTPASRSVELSTSSHTRAMIAPTVRHAMRISSVAALLEVCVANHATCWSKTVVCPAP